MRTQVIPRRLVIQPTIAVGNPSVPGYHRYMNQPGAYIPSVQGSVDFRTVIHVSDSNTPVGQSQTGGGEIVSLFTEKNNAGDSTIRVEFPNSAASATVLNVSNMDTIPKNSNFINTSEMINKPVTNYKDVAMISLPSTVSSNVTMVQKARAFSGLSADVDNAARMRSLSSSTESLDTQARQVLRVLDEVVEHGMNTSMNTSFQQAARIPTPPSPPLPPPLPG